MPCVEVAEKLRVDCSSSRNRACDRTVRPVPAIRRADRSPWVGLNFDIGHAYCVGEDPQDWVGRMAPHTRHYHLEDIAATRMHQHLIPGRGAIDFAATLVGHPSDGL